MIVDVVVSAQAVREPSHPTEGDRAGHGDLNARTGGRHRDEQHQTDHGVTDHGAEFAQPQPTDRTDHARHRQCQEGDRGGTGVNHAVPGHLDLPRHSADREAPLRVHRKEPGGHPPESEDREKDRDGSMSQPVDQSPTCRHGEAEYADTGEREVEDLNPTRPTGGELADRVHSNVETLSGEHLHDGDGVERRPGRGRDGQQGPCRDGSPAGGR